MHCFPRYMFGFFVILLTAQQGFSQMIVGHRGASFDAPENTLAAFQEAWRQQADAVEGDFYLTQDRQVVCIHDPDTQRTGRQKLDVARSTLAQLRQLEYGSWKAERFRGEPIPTLGDVLQCVPQDKTLVIELKTGPEIVSRVHQQLEQHQVDLSRVMMISFHEETIAQCKQLLPDVRAHWLTGYKQNPSDGVWHPTVDEISHTLQRCAADGLGTKGDRNVVTREFIDALRKRGMREFHVWTVDAPDDARYFQRLGAIGITTNRPDHIRRGLDGPVPIDDAP